MICWQQMGGRVVGCQKSGRAGVNPEIGNLDPELVNACPQKIKILSSVVGLSGMRFGSRIERGSFSYEMPATHGKVRPFATSPTQ